MHDVEEKEEIERIAGDDELDIIKPREDDEEEGTPWLMSFADMVTLLMCFFILFFSVAEKNPTEVNDTERLTKQLQVLLGYADDNANPTKIENNELQTSSKKSESSSNSPSTNNVDVAFAVGYSEPDTVELVLLSSSLFRPGGVDISSTGKKLLKEVTRELSVIAPDSRIEIEGHTDSDPIRGGRFRSNWELSTARAASVAHELIENEIDPTKIRVAGYAHYKPLVNEYDSRGHPIINNKALNRRIVVKIKSIQNNKDDASGSSIKTDTLDRSNRNKEGGVNQ